MKNIKWMAVLAFSGFFFNACLDDEPVARVEYKNAPIDSVHIGEIRPARMVTEITTFFTRNNECEVFFDYDYQIAGKERTITVITSNIQNGPCQEIQQVSSNLLQFKPEESGNYTFRFWSGNNENDEPQFIIHKIEIP